MRRTAVRRALIVLGGAVAAVLLTPALASAHPLGNFTVSSYAGLTVGADRVDVDFVVDMAEIPTFQARPEIDRNRDGDIARGEAARYARTRCAEMTKGLRLVVDDATAVLRPGASAATLPAGQAGLATLRLECQYDAAVAPADSHTLTFANRNLADRVGWHEVTAVGVGARLRGSDVPSRSLSARLTEYPSDRLQSPPDVRTAALDFRPGGDTAERAAGHHPHADGIGGARLRRAHAVVHVVGGRPQPHRRPGAGRVGHRRRSRRDPRLRPGPRQDGDGRVPGGGAGHGPRRTAHRGHRRRHPHRGRAGPRRGAHRVTGVRAGVAVPVPQPREWRVLRGARHDAALARVPTAWSRSRAGGTSPSCVGSLARRTGPRPRPSRPRSRARPRSRPRPRSQHGTITRRRRAPRVAAW